MESTARPRLLFVDDEARILVSLKSIFRTDYDVRTANSGAEALDILRDWPADVLISDQRMPEMTGVDVLRSAAELRPDTTRILLTGYSDLEAIIGSVNDGEIFRFVSKPWRRNELRDTVAAAVRVAARAQAANDPSTPSDDAPVETVPAAPSRAADDRTGVLVLDADAAEREALGRFVLRSPGTDQATSHRHGDYRIQYQRRAGHHAGQWIASAATRAGLHRAHRPAGCPAHHRPD